VILAKSPCGSDGSDGNRQKGVAFRDERFESSGGDHAAFGEQFQLVDALVSLFLDNLELGDEVGCRPGAPGGPIVRPN
jgi:hypothetical protein